MSQKFQPKRKETATEQELEEAAVITVGDWNRAISSAERRLKRYLEAETNG